jgi:site-specific DNA-methyltransferase (adenine-specific)
VEWLRTLEDEAIDLIITDLPYESLEKWRKRGTTTRLAHSKASSNDWFTTFPNARFPELFEEMYRVLKRDAHLYFFCDSETMFVAKPVGEQAGFKFWKPIVWDKMVMGMGYHYRAQYEFVLFFEKGKRKLRDLGMSDIIPVKRVHRGYPTEKPERLVEVFIQQSSEDNDVVCDPFMGSGPVACAAARRGRKFIGCDLAEEAVEVTRRRLEARTDAKVEVVQGRTTEDTP